MDLLPDKAIEERYAIKVEMTASAGAEPAAISPRFSRERPRKNDWESNLARAHARLVRDGLEEQFFENEAPEKPHSTVKESPPFLRRNPSLMDQEWNRHTVKWSKVIALAALLAPVTIGIALGHWIIGAAIGAVALLVVSLFAFGIYVLDNTLPL